MTDSVAEVLKKKSFNPSEIEMDYIADLKVIDLKDLAKAFQDEAKEQKELRQEWTTEWLNDPLRLDREILKAKCLEKTVWINRFLLYVKLCKGRVLKQ